MKQFINYVITWVLWLAAVVLWAAAGFPWLFVFLFFLHLAELLVIGWRTGRQYGVSAGRSILMCMLYGYNWWLPLRRQMQAETFTDMDFAREP